MKHCGGTPSAIAIALFPVLFATISGTLRLEPNKRCMPVYFYNTKENPYGCFTNFSRHGFELDGDWWTTSEHYFQAQKFAGTPHAEEIRKLLTPREAFNQAHKLNHLVRSDWLQIRDDVMRKVVERKFEFNADIRAVLLSTGDALLVEDSPTDSYWGCGGDRKGKNMLGKILMEVREKLRCLNS